MRTHVGLLRGINVGGKNLIKMADLRTMLESLGLCEAETLLQSGNVVFSAEGRSREDLESILGDETERRFGFRPEYFVRSAEEWEGIVARNPFPEAAEADPSHLLAIVTKRDIDSRQVEAVQAAVKGPERMRAVGDVLYVVYPDGIGTSTLPKTPGWNKLGASGTGRNWNTVSRLAELVRREA